MRKLIAKLLKSTLFVLMLCCYQQACAEQMNKKGLTMGSNENSVKIIENFYRYFNDSELEKLLTLISENCTYEINHGGIKKGKKEAYECFKYGYEHYKEKVSNIIYMVSDDGRFVAVRFVINGKYLKTDESKIPAMGQNYELDIFNFFEIKNNQIVDSKYFYDEAALISQYKKTPDVNLK